MGLFKEGKFFSFPTFLAAVFGLGFGASIFLNVQQHARASQDAKLMQGTITDLKYQVDQDHKQLAGAASPMTSSTPSDSPIATPEPSTTPSTTPTPSPTPAGQVAGASTVPALKYACNVHATANINSTDVWTVGQLQAKGLPAYPGSPKGSWQNVTYGGKPGFVLSSCLN
jgi:cytoskeletal protein RodZ